MVSTPPALRLVFLVELEVPPADNPEQADFPVVLENFQAPVEVILLVEVVARVLPKWGEM